MGERPWEDSWKAYRDQQEEQDRPLANRSCFAAGWNSGWRAREISALRSAESNFEGSPDTGGKTPVDLGIPKGWLQAYEGFLRTPAGSRLAAVVKEGALVSGTPVPEQVVADAFMVMATELSQKALEVVKENLYPSSKEIT